MASRAVVIRYGDETVNPAGNFTVTAYFMLADPARVNDPGFEPRSTFVTDVVLPVGNPATWSNAIKTAVIGAAAAQGFTDLTASTVHIPTIS